MMKKLVALLLLACCVGHLGAMQKSAMKKRKSVSFKKGYTLTPQDNYYVSSKEKTQRRTWARPQSIVQAKARITLIDQDIQTTKDKLEDQRDARDEANADSPQEQRAIALIEALNQELDFLKDQKTAYEKRLQHLKKAQEHPTASFKRPATAIRRPRYGW